MGDTKCWVVVTAVEGPFYIRRRGNTSLPSISATTTLAYYAVMEQKWPTKVLYLGLEIPTNTDHLCIAYQEMEAFVRALAVEEQAPITVGSLKITDKPEEWPKWIRFLGARDFPQCSRGWEPVDHYKDPKNRVRFTGTINRGASATDATDWGAVLEKSHQAFSGHNQYQQDLVKDYLAGLDVEFTNIALAMLYFFKVLERIGKEEYGNPAKGTMKDKTLKAIIANLDTELTAEDKQHLKTINRWRNTKSEAHLITEGLPTGPELELCRRVAHQAILKRI